VSVRTYASQFTTDGVTITPAELFEPDRKKEFCVAPRTLTVSDASASGVTMIDSANFGAKNLDGRPMNAADPFSTLAHELGHSLLLGHGDGVDNDHNGVLPPAPGNRWYDAYCDPAGVNAAGAPIEDLLGGAAGCGSVMLGGSAQCHDIQPLQREAARDAAALIPGAIVFNSTDPSGMLALPGRCRGPKCSQRLGPSIQRVEVVQERTSNQLEVSLNVVGQADPEKPYEYWLFIDADSDEKTGCTGKAAGLNTRFRGAEIVAQVEVPAERAKGRIRTKLLSCQHGRFRRADENGVRASMSGYVGSNGVTLGGKKLTLVLSENMTPERRNRLRLEADVSYAQSEVIRQQDSR